jgi:histidine ammonia-lyase
MTIQPLLLDKEKISIDDLVTVARSNQEVDVTAAGEGRVAKTSALIERWVKEKRIIYGITTGFGALCNVTISAEDTRGFRRIFS